MEQTVESNDYETIKQMTDMYGELLDEFVADRQIEKVTAQHHDYVFATMFQYWYGGKTPPSSQYMTAVKAFEMIVMKHQIYGMPAMWCRMIGVGYNSAMASTDPPMMEAVDELKRITKTTAQYKLSDSTLGQIALANHDRTVGLEYERKGAVERAALGQVKNAKQLPMFF